MLPPPLLSLLRLGLVGFREIGMGFPSGKGKGETIWSGHWGIQ
jgi:hypothetical protein